MRYTTIRMEGAILSSDILDRIEQGEMHGQLAGDFGLEKRAKVKDEIARAWADAQDLWRIFKRRKERVADKGYGTTETRRFWLNPLLGFFGYDARLSTAETVHGKSYAISHRASNLDGFPIHIVGFNDSLDKKRDHGGARMSPHALVQEYINLTEHLYALVTNGLHLRLLRDSSRLIKLSFIEFDLQTMMEEEHYADFAIMFRLLHVSRMPRKMDRGGDSRIEAYHQDALDAGSRIREGLSRAVENSIHSLANGFLAHPDNEALRADIEKGAVSAPAFYQYQLRLVYRLLFLMVIEERNLIFPRGADAAKREIYYNYYSVSRLRKLCEKPHLMDARFNDLWISLKHTFHLFENQAGGSRLGISPLAGDLFGYRAIGALNHCNLDNRILLECLENLSVFIHRKTGQKMRVNYASLNVEEFGSVYEGLLEYDPVITPRGRTPRFDFKKGSARSSSGSHYTPDELVQPLIKHSLDHVIEEKLAASPQKEAREKALLSIKVCDVACGSGHILLNAARRIGSALARVRTGEDQPSPGPLRHAIRDVIGSCIYGVDKNPLAVELCKVALWLEAHNPGEPLNFLDHHVKCGDAIVGLAHKEELENGVAGEAFKAMPGDDKKIRADLAKRNKRERKERPQRHIDVGHVVDGSIADLSKVFTRFNALPETTIEEIEHKRTEYAKMTAGVNWMRLKTLADIQVAQFFIPKTEENESRIVTDEEYMDYLSGLKAIHPMKAGAAGGLAAEKRFFHWFLEFPEIFSMGGFDCIVGNPPFLGGQRISGNYSSNYLNWLKALYSITGSCDLVTYFFRRIYNIIKKHGFFSLISTNSISQGVAREGGLEVILNNNGSIVFAISSMKWPGIAAVEISLVGVYKGKWKYERILNNKKVPFINSFLDDSIFYRSPHKLSKNIGISFMGSTVVGPGFILSNNKAQKMLLKDHKNSEIIFPYLNGRDLNTSYDQSASRMIINFFDYSVKKAKAYGDCFDILEKEVKPFRLEKKYSKKSTELWWQYYRPTIELYKKIRNLKHVIAVAQVSKTLAFSFVDSNQVFDAKLIIFAFDKSIIFAIMQSCFHSNWAWKYCTTMKSDLSYGNERIFETFPFPQDTPIETETDLERLGEEYHDFRRELMLRMQLGLTKTYNQFHNPALKEFPDEDAALLSKLKAKEFQKQHGKETFNLWKHLDKTEGACAFNEAARDVFRLRELHGKMDETVKKAYGWEDIDLAHRLLRNGLPAGKRPRPLHHIPRRPERDLETPAQAKPRDLRAGGGGGPPR